MYKRQGINQIRLLETPEVYKRIIKIQKMVRNTLGALAFISICLGGFGIMNLIAGGVKARTCLLYTSKLKSGDFKK